MRFLSLLSLMLLLFSCEGDTASRRAARGADFVSDPDHLYFLNTRSRDYQAVTRKEGVELYRHDDLIEERAVLQPYILDVWIEDRAELYFTFLSPEGDEVEQDFSLEIGQDEVVIIDGPLDARRLLPIYQQFSGTRPVSIRHKGKLIDAFARPEDRAAAREVIADYLRLVGAN